MPKDFGSYVDHPLTLEQITKRVSDFERKQPFGIRYRVLQEDDRISVQAWELGQNDWSRPEQRRYGEKIEVLPEGGPKMLYEALYDSGQSLME